MVLLDPTDEEYSIGFNFLSAHSELEKNLLASDLVSVFRRLSTSWGDQMASVLQNAILAILESTRGGTLADLRRFLLDEEFREEFLETVKDPEVVYYWEQAFAQLSRSELGVRNGPKRPLRSGVALDKLPLGPSFLKAGPYSGTFRGVTPLPTALIRRISDTLSLQSGRPKTVGIWKMGLQDRVHGSKVKIGQNARILQNVREVQAIERIYVGRVGIH